MFTVLKLTAGNHLDGEGNTEAGSQVGGGGGAGNVDVCPAALVVLRQVVSDELTGTRALGIAAVSNGVAVVGDSGDELLVVVLGGVHDGEAKITALLTGGDGEGLTLVGVAINGGVLLTNSD